jgi:hypothetical protein
MVEITFCRWALACERDAITGRHFLVQRNATDKLVMSWRVCATRSPAIPMIEERIEIITPVSAEKRRAQEVKARLLAGFVVLSVLAYNAVAVALKPHSGGSDRRVGAASYAKPLNMAGRLLTADGTNPG